MDELSHADETTVSEAGMSPDNKFAAQHRFSATLSVFALILTSFGCDSLGKPPILTAQGSPQTVVGINLHSTTSSFPTAPTFGDLYTRLRINTEILRDHIDGEEARTLATRVKNFFGISAVHEIGLSVSITQGSYTSPRIIPFSYIYDESKPQWTSSLLQQFRTPYVLLKPGTSFDLEYKYLASDQATVTTAEALGSFIVALGTLNPGTWALSPASAALVNQVAPIIDKQTAAAFLSGKIVAGVQTELLPIDDNRKTIAITAQDLSGSDLVRITFTAELTSSLLKEHFKVDPQSEAEALPSFNPSRKPEALELITLTGKTSDGILRALLMAEPAFTMVTGAHDAEQLEKGCRALFNTLGGQRYNLNRWDKLLSTENVLRQYTSFFQNREFYNSRCLGGVHGEELQQLASMGVVVGFQERVQKVTPEMFESIGTYMQNPTDGKSESIGNALTDPVAITDAMSQGAVDTKLLTPSEAVAKLAQVRVDHFGCWDKPEQESKLGQRGMQFAFTVIGDPQDYIFEAYGRTEDPTLGIAVVKMRRAVAGDCRWDKSRITQVAARE